MEDDLIDDVHEQMAKKKPTPTKQFFEKIPNSVLFVFGVIFIFLLYLMAFKEFPAKNALMMLAGGGFIVWLFTLSYKQKGSMLTEQECKVRLWEQLRYKQLNTSELPQGEITIGLIGKLRFLNEEPWKREIAFKVTTMDGLDLSYSADVDVYSGDIIAVYDRPEGFTGTTAPDIRVIAGRDILALKQYESFRGIRRGLR